MLLEVKKYLIYFLIILVAVTGCNNHEEEEIDVETTYTITYNDDYYTIYKPYKKGVGNNYILNSNVVDFDVQAIEKNLIQISTTEFEVDKYYYQEGQYLTQDRLKELLGNESLNKTDKKKVDGKTLKPEMVAGIYEKNFLNKNGDIKGISLGIILNKYQSYDSNNNYVTLEEDEVIDFGKKAGQKLLKYMRKNFELDNVPILIALYLESSPESNVSGNYIYYGITENSEISYSQLHQKNYYMNTNTVKQIDENSYNNFSKFEDSIREYDNSIYVSGLGRFDNNSLTKLDITITKTYYSYGELLHINQLLSDKAIKYFKDIKVVIELKAINDIKSYIVKEPGETSTDIFIY